MAQVVQENEPLYKNKRWLYEQYLAKNKDIKIIAQEQGVHDTTIWRSLKKFGIPLRKKRYPNGHSWSEEAKKKRSIFMKGKPSGAKGYKWSEEQKHHKRKISPRGANHWHWKGGINKNPFYISAEWMELATQIRKRDYFQCQNCGVYSPPWFQLGALHVHHIDYDITNNNFENLITLCHSCHSATNIKNKHYWVNKFQNYMGGGDNPIRPEYQQQM